MVRDVHLEGRDTTERSRWSTDLRRVVGKCCEVVAEQRARGGEPITRQLHAIAGVAGKPDHNPVELLRDRGAAFHEPKSFRLCRTLRRAP